ncbi:hypothetical protein PHYPSEUDO_009129 [Phytophthora pseudosyringae]|uniref:Calcineurin-like phosphoesterase domain-containing protein n=1 Tax=Phytophthora pseudosyringae TaxID=221518 RepID=A0A8T1VHY5_9STRA|nr:hypothetical protein PHYPSEUDO_009129 [Phytophthora pseudosyringae]
MSFLSVRELVERAQSPIPGTKNNQDERYEHLQRCGDIGHDGGGSGALTVSSGLTATLSSDPASAQYTLSAFATGDWGATTYKGSCCGSKYTNYDLNAQEVVAALMNIYLLPCSPSRVAATFEAKYDGENIKNVPWVNVMGNHDYGGSDYICSSAGKLVPCNNTEELFQGLDNKLKWQAEYTSPNDNR